MIANVYVDGFNLYYGRLKNTQNKWLDLERLCDQMLPNFQVKRIRYFTARVSAMPHNPDVARRQQVYLKALYTLPRVTVHFGHFLVNNTRMALTNPPARGPQTVEVIKTEEKGSDVNLATYLMADAFRSDADAFVVVSNDSDLKEPMRMVKHELHKVVGLLNPHDTPSQKLAQCRPDFVKQIRNGVVAVSQLPPRITDAYGNVIEKPHGWV